MVSIQKSFQSHEYGTLYLVPTPIGNLDDITVRAIKTLEQVDIVLSEDTRHTQKLLNHFQINKKQLSLHEHNIISRIPQIIDLLQQGLMIAQVSDAGMPSISDPGKELVFACIQEKINVVALPGANAGITGLIASGLAPQPFYFHGFLPRKKQEQLEILNQLKFKEETMIFYESPNRLKKTLHYFLEVFNHHRQVVICRELTKKYEEYIRGSLKEVSEYLNDIEVKGEICLMISGCLPSEKKEISVLSLQETLGSLSLKEQVDFFIEHDNIKVNDAIKKVAKNNQLTKQEVYKIYHIGEL